MLLIQIERVLEQSLFKDSSNGIKGLANNISNELNEYRLTINIKKRDVLAASRASADIIRTNDSTVELEITDNSDAQDKADL